MHLLIKTGIATSGPAFEAGDVVDWKPDEEAARLIKKGFAEEASAEEIKVAGKKAKRYQSPPQRSEDKWPPKPPPATVRDRGALAKED